MEYHFKVHKDGTGFWAECIELDGCVTQGDSKSELRENMKEVLNLYLEEPAQSNHVFPAPRKRLTGKNIEKVSVDPNLAFAVQLRNLRLQRKLTQKEVAERLGVKNLYSYQRLESSAKANPALSTIVRIKEVFPEFRLDEVV